MTTEKHVKAILERTFMSLQSIYDSQKEGNPSTNNSKMSRIIFPEYREYGQRVCEQELRFVFVEQLYVEIQNGWDVFYSVETPTEKAYTGFNTGNPKRDINGRSGAIDLVIHDNTYKRIALIEFKAHDARTGQYVKDFCKLENEKAECKFFVNILENVNKGTFKSIHGKIDKYLNSNICFKLWSLGDNKDVTKEIVEL